MAGKTFDGRSWIRCEKCGYVVYGRNTDEAYELYEEHVKKCRIDRRKLEMAIDMDDEFSGCEEDLYEDPKPRKREGKREEVKNEEVKDSSKSDIIKDILEKLPPWADGAVIATLGMEFLPSVRPVKRSKYHSGYFTSKKWKPIDGNGMTVHVLDYQKVVAFYRERGKVVILKDSRVLKVARVTEGKDLNFNIYVE
jgi:hypothetical protein